ncbi:hypothetical protein OROHE_003584 [Orobanche hederae]
MADPVVLIPDVTKGLNRWTVKVTVTEEMPTLVGFQHGTKYKRYVLTDDEIIPAVVYSRDIASYERTLHLHGVYNISNAVVRRTTPPQNTLGSYTHWVLQRDTLICPLHGEVPNLRYFLDGVIPLAKTLDYVKQPDAFLDVLAVGIKAEDPKTVTTKSGPGRVQNFILVDSGMFSIPLSLWDQHLEHYGAMLTTAATNHSVVVAKRLKARDHRGAMIWATLSTDCFRYRFDEIGIHHLPKLLEDYSIPRAKDLADRNLVRKYSIQEIQETECGQFWTRAFLQVTDANQSLHYIGCSNCHTKVNAIADSKYPCQLCNKPAVASIRPCISIDVTDHTGRITVGAIDTVAEQILQCTAAQLEQFVKQGIGFELDPVMAEFRDKPYLILLRRKFSTRPASERRLLLLAYFQDADIPKGPTSTTQVHSPVTSRCAQRVSTTSKSYFCRFEQFSCSPQ